MMPTHLRCHVQQTRKPRT